MVVQHYPLDIKKFPDDDDILLNEDDLRRKNVLYCRREILEQMKCTQWAKEEYLSAGLDPDNHPQWLHYHLQKCYTPYQNGIGCVISITDKEIQKMKQEAGPEGWQLVKEKFIQDTARKVGENKAKMMWEYKTNMKEIHEKMRRRDGHFYGEGPPPDSSSTSTIGKRPPTNVNLAEAMGVSEYLKKNEDAATTKPSHLRVEQMFVAAKQREVDEATKAAQKKKSFWGWFGS